MKSWTHSERREFPPGPWDDEPDKIQWIDPGTDLDCLIVRNPMGALCGYVGVPPGHPWHGLGYGEIEDDIDVHGGLTFAASCNENAPEGHGVCHVPEPGRPADVWWLGFDCAHSGDVVPIVTQYEQDYPVEMRFYGRTDAYRDVEYVTGQCQHLAAQVIAAAVAA